MRWQSNNKAGFLTEKAGSSAVRQGIGVCLLILVVVLFLLPFSGFSQLNRQKPENLQNTDIEERLGDRIPLDIVFADAVGDSVTVRDLMRDDKPVILNPVYYNCPMLCSMVTDAIYTGIENLKWDPGDEYRIITFSFDPDEHRQLADSTSRVYAEKLGSRYKKGGWHFLTGKKPAIRKLTEAIGFNYQKVERTGEYAHSAAVVFLGPDGTITRYLYGIKFNEFQVRNALYDAAEGKIGNTVDKIVMYCYQYDPGSRSYVPVAWRIMQLGGLATVLILGIFLGLLWLKEKGSNNDSNSIKQNERI